MDDKTNEDVHYYATVADFYTMAALLPEVKNCPLLKEVPTTSYVEEIDRSYQAGELVCFGKMYTCRAEGVKSLGTHMEPKLVMHCGFRGRDVQITLESRVLKRR